jgi:predicted transcriptional regulator
MLRLNIIELRLRNKQISQEKEYHITYHKPIEYKESKQIESIEKRVLSMLLEGSKTSREIEVAIGRSREHTARLMKKLYEKGYVIRDTSNKPYKYSITEVGKSIIETEAV